MLPNENLIHSKKTFFREIENNSEGEEEIESFTLKI